VLEGVELLSRRDGLLQEAFDHLGQLSYELSLINGRAAVEVIFGGLL
jgi:hypothetical protein